VIFLRTKKKVKEKFEHILLLPCLQVPHYLEVEAKGGLNTHSFFYVPFETLFKDKIVTESRLQSRQYLRCMV